MDLPNIEDLSLFLNEIPAVEFFECARTRPPGLGKDPKFLELQKAMRALVPVPGDKWVHDIEVLIDPGSRWHQGQRVHSHPEWTAIFYVDPAGVSTWIRSEGVDVAVTPDPGDCLIIPPDMEHWVAPHFGDRPRLSFAMLVQIPGRGSKYT